jgi:hypothetical protein
LVTIESDDLVEVPAQQLLDLVDSAISDGESDDLWRLASVSAHVREV